MYSGLFNKISFLFSKFEEISSYQAIAPHDAGSGQLFPTLVNGQHVFVKVPNGVKPGQIFQFTLDECSIATQTAHIVTDPNFIPTGTQQIYSVQLPSYAIPGQVFVTNNSDGFLMKIKC